jgi:hypothetical protein
MYVITSAPTGECSTGAHSIAQGRHVGEIQKIRPQFRRTLHGDLGIHPTMIVSLWWRVWLQRQTTDSRSTIKEAIS